MRSFLRLLRPVDRLATRLDPLPSYPAILTAPAPTDVPLDATPAYFAPTLPSATTPAPASSPARPVAPSAHFVWLAPRSIGLPFWGLTGR